MNESFEGYEQMAREQPRSKYNRGSGSKQDKFSPAIRDGHDESDISPGIPVRQQASKSNAPRAMINIDENEDTFHNDQDFYQRVINKGKNLASHMEEALGDDAWRQIHGPHAIPKSYVAPFTQNGQDAPAGNNHSDNVYDMEIEANLNRKRAKNEKESEQQITSAPNQIIQGGSDIVDMKFIKLNVKTLSINDQVLLKELIEENQLNLVLSVPLVNLYTKQIDKQIVKVSNFEYNQLSSQGAFDFNYSTTFKFAVNDETLTKWSNSELHVFIENKMTSGTVSMAKLQLARGFKLKHQIPLFREISEKEQIKNFRTEPDAKVDPKKKKNDKVSAKQETRTASKEVLLQGVGMLEIEISLQRGDSEEEASRNFNIKLNQQQELQEHEQKVKALERRQQAVYQMEKEPIFAQLYLNIGQVGQGGITIDREGRDIQPQIYQEGAQDRPVQEGQLKVSQGDFQTERIKLAMRSLFVRYKSFPPSNNACQRLETSVQFSDDTPNFRHRAQFPMMMSTNNIEMLEKFTFRLEVWDQVQSGQDQLVGIVKIPLASFCHTLKTNHEDTFSLNFLAHQHNQYPIMIINEELPIFSFQHDKNVGTIKVTMGLGTPVQVNRWIENEKELEQTQMKQILEQERSNLQRQLMKDMARTQAGGTMQGQEEKMKSLISDAELKRKREEEEEMHKNPLMSLLGGKSSNLNTPGKRPHQMDKFANALRMSLASAGNQDFDIRQTSYLNSLRKLFEDIRVLQYHHNVTFESIFGQDLSYQSSTVTKDDFVYSMLRTDGITLTKNEISQVCELLLNIDGKDDKGSISVTALQKSLDEYLKQCEIIKNRVIDLLEKILMTIQKKLETFEEIDDLCQAITDRCTDSKILRQDLRIVLEDQHGIVIRDAIYDQLCAYFDLDRSGQIYITSMLDYIKDPTISHFNFFKVSPHVISARISEYVKDQISCKPEQLVQLEAAFTEDIFLKKCTEEVEEDDKNKNNKKNPYKKSGQPPVNLLLNEKINAKMFQARLKRHGVDLSLWEIFTLFEYLNTVLAKQNFYEPLRYHQCLWEHFNQLVTGRTDYRSIIENRMNPNKKKKFGQQQVNQKDWNNIDALDLAESLNDTSDLTSSSSDEDDSDDNNGQVQDLSKKRRKEEKKPFSQVKHVFDINLTSLYQIPILQKFINNNTDFELASQEHPQQSAYIQSVAMKYSFPLDEDEIYESDYIKRNPKSTPDYTIYDYDVSMNTVHTYKLSKKDSIQNHLTKGSLFNISLVMFQDQKEFIIGNAQMPIEDILDLVEDYEKQKKTYMKMTDTSVMKKVMFIYGTSYSQRENCIIGKVGITFTYNVARQILSQKEAALQRNNPLDSCFLHRETYINRKIPLNAVLTFYIDRVTNLKESLENIEHFAKIHQDTLLDNSIVPKSQKVDRRRVLTQILKQGLNLEVISSMFLEDASLKERFGASEQRTRKLYNSLCPVFDECYQLPIQMDTKIFDYLKTKRAVFEVRHYITTKEDETDPAYITLGFVKVPLLHLITKNNGIDGEFNILDEYKQKMGSLRLRIALNHHNNARPLFQGSNKTATTGTQRPGTLIDRSLRDTRGTSTSLSIERQIISKGKYLLCINFIELIMRERSDLINLQPDSASSLYLKFKILNQEFRSKFIPLQKDSNGQLISKSKVNVMTFDVNRTVFVDIDMDNTFEVEDAFGRPLEIQLWHKVTSEQKYAQPSHEDLVGSFFVELNELPKVQNKKIKGHRQDQFLCHESYFTMYDFKKEQVSQERLGVKLYLIYNTHPTFKEELDRVFNTIVNIGEMDKIQEAIHHRLDPLHLGYADLDELIALAEDQISDKRTSLTLCSLLGENLEYKNDKSVYYSPILCLPPPYFKYTEEIDSSDTVIQFFWELLRLDSHQTGFIPVSLMKTVMIEQLRVKQKIVEDFIQEVTNNILDTNRTANSLQTLQFDYMLLIRKLLMSTPARNQNQTTDEQATLLILDVKIESAIRLQNPENRYDPPNTFVRVKSPFDGGICDIQTIIVEQSCYPYWPNPKLHQIQIPLTKNNLQRIKSMPLEFEVMHMKSQESFAYPIGVAFVDISTLVNTKESGKSMISGYFDIVDRNAVRNSVQGQQAFASNGQLKLTIKKSDLAENVSSLKFPLSRTMPSISQDESENHHPVNAQWSQTFGTKKDQHVTLASMKAQKQQETSSQHPDEMFNDDVDYDDDKLRAMHAKNMSDLDTVLQKLKMSLVSSEFNPNMTVQYDKERMNMADQLQVVQKNAHVFNPFESKIGEHEDEVEEEQFYEMDSDEQLARDDI